MVLSSRAAAFVRGICPRRTPSSTLRSARRASALLVRLRGHQRVTTPRFSSTSGAKSICHRKSSARRYRRRARDDERQRCARELRRSATPAPPRRRRYKAQDVPRVQFVKEAAAHADSAAAADKALREIDHEKTTTTRRKSNLKAPRPRHHRRPRLRRGPLPVGASGRKLVRGHVRR